MSRTVRFLFEKPQRLVSLVCAMLSNLSAGTRYAFPLFGPPIAKQLGYSHLQLNIIASAGDIGTYLSAPLFGGLVDNYGASFGCLLAATFMFAGFHGLATMFAGIFGSSYWLAAFFLIFVGAGSSSACMAALSTTARNFPPDLRGSMLGLPISFFGLSALVLSFINSWWFVAPSSIENGVEKGGETDTGGGHSTPNSPLTPVSIIDTHERMHFPNRPRASSDAPLLLNASSAYNALSSSDNCHVIDTDDLSMHALFQDRNFWQLWSMMGILTGTGLMYITNVGGIIRQLLLDSPAKLPPSERELQLAASMHVALISLASFSARLIAGALSDYAKRNYNIRRLSFIIATGIIMMVAQLMALTVSTPSGLLVVTLVIGSAYGALFTLFTAITSEYWGLSTFGRNCLVDALAITAIAILFILQ
ncbi:major facilitator superfamily domain-containing protein [Syncephalis fuscata]|nr:major facilitator superfamily domain-containing protein [Syncephalis fuscata]